MPVQSIKNQYRGINAHLHSFWQATGTWNRFHNYLIAQMMGALRREPLPMGYTAEIEESVQIRRLGDDAPRLPRADLLIRDLRPERETGRPLQTAGGVILALEALEEPEEDLEHPYTALVIYQRTTDARTGDIVAWIELLSPTNKGNQRDAFTYLAKRRLLLENGIVFVEIDFLHETPPTFERLPDYTHQEIGSHPYRIIVIDPRPVYREAKVYLHEFDVDEALPALAIPLNESDSLEVDFNHLYHKTFIDAVYGYDMDYAELPLNFERYSETDQWRIARRMIAVLEAASQGIDLEQASLPVNDDQGSKQEMTLQDALAQLAALKTKLQG